jgi:hypothetical protein
VIHSFQPRRGWLCIISGTCVFLMVPLALAMGGLLFAATFVQDLDSEISGRRTAISRLKRAATANYAALQHDDAADLTSLKSDFLPGAQDAIITAELQNRLRALALSNAVELNSANALPARNVGANSYLGLRLFLRGRVADIQTVLHSIETSSPLLFVERASLRVDPWPMKSADPARQDAPALVVELDVYGAKLPAVPNQAVAASVGTDPLNKTTRHP